MQTHQPAAAHEPYEASRLRPVTLKDVAKLVELYNEARTPTETHATMVSWLEHGGGLLLETSTGELLCAIRWREDEGGWRIDRIATLPESRGLGYGRWLMTRLEALAIRNNIPSLTLTLNELRDDLTRYYTRMGYQVISKDATSVTLDKRVGGVWQVKA